MRNKNLDFIKLIALLCMILSHSCFIFPEYQYFLNSCGRWVFILFSFVLAQNIYTSISNSHFSSIKNYVCYSLVFAVLSEGPHSLMVSTNQTFHLGPQFPLMHNIFYTYFFGILAILVFSIPKNPFLKILLISCFLSFIFPYSRSLEYGLYGVSLIVSFYGYISSNSYLKYFYLLISLFCSISATAQYYYSLKLLFLFGILSAFIFVIFVSKININFYVPKMGKWLYFFYPLHMALIYLIAFNFS